MIPGCTHAVDLALDDKTIDLNQASDVYVTLKQGGTLITLTGAARHQRLRRIEEIR